jgi:DNA-binding SARP family transcriptional activator
LPETLRMTQVRGQLQAVDHAQDRVKVRARGHQIPMAEACCKAAALWRGSLLPEGRYLSWLDALSAPLCQRYAELFRVFKLWQQLIALEPNGEPAQCALMQAALNGTKRGDAT